MTGMFEEYVRFVFPVLGFVIIAGCVLSLFFKRPKTKTVAFLVNSKSGEAVPLHYWETSIGRSPSCDIVLNYPTVSRFHSVVSRRKNTWVIFDTGSKTGIILNGQKIKKKEKLSDGDKLTFGEASYIFSAPDFGDRVKGEKILEYELISTTNGKKFRLDGTFFTIGRGKDCDVYLNLPTVSRKHVELTFTDGKWKMTNFSSNGVYVNSRQYMKEKILKNGDILDIGGAKIKFAERE
ncbi:MAG: FHA domain-containing protein [Clostridia bacterium]|nr:FHA domain-containing protein [Clostridia bacterium]